MGNFARDKATVVLTELYENREKLARDYYNSKHWMRYSTAMRRRPVRPIYITRRRLTSAKRAIITPVRSVKRARMSNRGATSRRTRSRAFSRRNIGEPIGSSNVKTVINTAGGPLSSRTLGQYDLTLIGENQTESGRERHQINCRGLKIDLNMYNLNGPGVAGGNPNLVFVNIAVLAQKNAATGNVPTDDFFRAIKNNDERAVNFSVDLTSEEFRNLPINTDLYTVLKHKRYVLRPYLSGVDKYWKTINWYIPIKRQLVYENTANTSCRNKIHLCIWCDKINEPAGSAASGNQINFQFRTTTYFRDTR